MTLDSATKKAYKEGIYTLFETLGTEVEFYYRNNESSNIDIYGDYINEEAIESYSLIATIKHKALDNNNFDRQKQGHTDECTIEIPLKVIEDNELEPYNMDSGYFKFEGREYEVMYVKPKGLFAQMFTSFEFSCKGVSPL